MNDVIITISREYGCGARVVGKRLAAKLGVDYYDREIIELAAKNSGFSEEFIEEAEQRTSNGILPWAEEADYTPTTLSLSNRVYLAQFSAIREIASKGTCVLVGRCSDAILKTGYNRLSVFLHAKKEDRIKYTIEHYGLNENNAQKKIMQIDSERAAHYKYYSDKEWGVCKNYDLSINMSNFSIEGATQIIINALASMSSKA